MGTDSAKCRLDNQLDAFFGRSAGTTGGGLASIKTDPIGDPSGRS